MHQNSMACVVIILFQHNWSGAKLVKNKNSLFVFLLFGLFFVCLGDGRTQDTGPEYRYQI